MNHFCRFRRTAPTRCWLVLAACLLLLSAHAQTVLVLQPGNTVSTLVGSGSDGTVKAGSGTQSPLGSPRALAYDTAGNLYVADARNHQILRVDAAGKLTILAGTGRQGFAGDSRPAVAAELNTPSGVAVDSAGNVFVADTGNQRVRRIAVADGTITTVAGNGVAGFSGDSGAAVAAALRQPTALAVDSSNALYIADSGNHRVRKLLSNGTLATVAGNGQEGDTGDGGPALAASFGGISGLAVLPDGRLLIADTEGRRVRAVATDGTVAAYSMGSLPVRRPAALAADGSSVYVADAALQTVSASGAGGFSTAAGTGEQGRLQPGAPLATALDTPLAVAPGLLGQLAVADAHNHQVQQVSAASLDFGSVPAGRTSAAQLLTLTNGSKAELTVAALDLPAGFATVASGSTCATYPFPLAPGKACTVALAFAPTIQGAADAVARVQLTGAAPQPLLLKGTGAPNGSLASSITALRSDGSIAYAGTAVTLSATVAGALLMPPAGTVTFMDGATPMAKQALNGGAAQATTASLTTGAHTLTAVYSGDAAYSTSTSAAVTVTVVPSPDFTLSAGAASYSGKAGESMTVPLTLLPVNGTLKGVVQIAVTGLPAGAVATFAPSTFVLGGGPASVDLTIKMPATLASIRHVPGSALALACTLLPVVLLTGLRRRMVYPLLSCVLLLAAVGCGSGFRAGTTAADLSSTTKSYTAVVTATTTGVLGTPLAHSTSVGLVISK